MSELADPSINSGYDISPFGDPQGLWADRRVRIGYETAEELAKCYNRENWRAHKELKEKHPDVVKITRKWGRWQHQVDYRPFKGNTLIKKEGVIIPDRPNEYGMKLVKLTTQTPRRVTG